jgi:hypothetical protein
MIELRRFAHHTEMVNPSAPRPGIKVYQSIVALEAERRVIKRSDRDDVDSAHRFAEYRRPLVAARRVLAGGNGRPTSKLE